MAQWKHSKPYVLLPSSWLAQHRAPTRSDNAQVPTTRRPYLSPTPFCPTRASSVTISTIAVAIESILSIVQWVRSADSSCSCLTGHPRPWRRHSPRHRPAVETGRASFCRRRRQTRAEKRFCRRNRWSIVRVHWPSIGCCNEEFGYQNRIIEWLLWNCAIQAGSGAWDLKVVKVEPGIKSLNDEQLPNSEY